MDNQYDAIVVGSGFGGTIMALTIAREFFLEWNKDKTKPKRKVLLMERGTWWTTPVGTVQDKEVAMAAMLKKQNHPVQYWSANNSFRGLIDILTRCTHHEGNVRGLFELTGFGTKGLLGLFGKNDGLTVLRASGVGGGSLVYSNITVQPPNLIFNDDRWKGMQSWLAKKGDYYNAARNAIGFSILRAWTEWDGIYNPDVAAVINNDAKLKKAFTPRVNTGLSQIVTRIAGHNPHWNKEKDAGTGDWHIVKNSEGQSVYQIDKEREKKTLEEIQQEKASDVKMIDDERDMKNELWVDRARVFHNGMEQLSKKMALEYSAHELSINDADTAALQFSGAKPLGSNLFDVEGMSKNYCERQGRCNVGCLPGARHTLNKQLVNAIFGKVDFKRDDNGELITDGNGNFQLLEPSGILNGFLEVEALSEVNYVEKIADNDYLVHFWKHPHASGKKSKRVTQEPLRTRKVILAAGTLGTNEIMLRSVKEKGLTSVSPTLGQGFSANGDNFYFMSKTKEKVRSTRGPVQTSHAHFNLGDSGKHPESMDTSDKENVFHMIEDCGIPPALASTVGFGQELFKRLAQGKQKFIPTLIAILNYLFKRGMSILLAPFRNKSERQSSFFNEDEVSANYLIVTSTGREGAKATIRLGSSMETPLRMERKNEKNEVEPFINDPVYTNIRKTLDSMAEVFADPKATGDDKLFITPSAKTVACSHPLGGCRIGLSSKDGVVDEFGHVFDTSKGEKGIHEGLYIADGSVIPTSLGVNPSLTIAAVCWHFAENIRCELQVGNLTVVSAAAEKNKLPT
jgi:choline dehydrogenase-like flavoprotein